MGKFDPWPEQGGLNDYEYFEGMTREELVQGCVAYMRRARLEIIKNEDLEYLRHKNSGLLDAARAEAEYWRDSCALAKGYHELDWPLPWEEGFDDAGE